MRGLKVQSSGKFVRQEDGIAISGVLPGFFHDEAYCFEHDVGMVMQFSAYIRNQYVGCFFGQTSLEEM